jgi:YegS/Rv2252/BmrU family lipid kinase
MEKGNDMPAEWMVLINPAAGNKKGRDDWGKISLLLDRYKVTYRHHFTEYPRHTIALSQDCLRQGYRNFIIAGGDGCLHEAVNAICAQTAVDPKLVTLAMIPVGTGNDWVRTFNIPSDYEAAIKVITQRKVLRHDIGRVFYHVNGEERSSYFINICGMGLDAEVNKRVSADRERRHLGHLKYQYHIFSALMGYTPTQMTIVIDDKEIHHEVLSLALGIAQYNGGGMKQLPFAVPDDGVFDLSVIKKATRLKVLRSTHKIYDGSFVELPEVSTYTGKSIQIRSEPKCSIEADGEDLGESPFRFEIIPQMLNVVIA